VNKKPERPVLTHEQALRNSVAVVEDYAYAVRFISEAVYFDDAEAAEAGNKEAERAYSELQLALEDARKAK
jgi:hypothetical protein